jgi:hypothetical protein
MQGAEVELSLGRQRVSSTQKRLGDLDARLTRLAQRRGEYSNRVAAVDNSRITLDQARQNLSTAKAAQAAAHSGSLVTRIDQPETGPYPAGPGRTVVAGAGAMGGLMLGLGLVFLSTGNSANESRQRDGSRPEFDARRAESRETSVPEWATQLRPSPLLRDEPLGSPAVEFHPAPNSAAFVEPQQIHDGEIKRSSVVAAAWNKNETQDIASGESSEIEGAVTGGFDNAISESSPSKAGGFQYFEASAVDLQPEQIARASEPGPPITPRPAALRTEMQSEKPPSHFTTGTFPWSGESIETIGESIETFEEETSDYSSVAWTPAARADVDPDYEPDDALESTLAEKKPVLPAPSGSLPKPGGKLPQLATTTAAGGMSLQEALKAARELQR